MNSCPHSENVIDYLLGLLSERENEEFKQHLQKCSVCQRELQLESAIENELALELQPGYIEEHVHARLKLRQEQSLRFSWLYAFRMGVYGVTAMVLALFLPPLILKFPFGQQIDVATYFNGLAALTARLLPSIQFSFVVVGLGSTFMIASVLYSLAYLRK